MKVSILSISVAAVFFTIEANAKIEDEKSKEKSMAKLPPCSACSVLVKSFEKGLERTSRGKFEGGDTAWEEKNQGKGYSTSEVRFVEIQEKLCFDVDRGSQQCHNNHQLWEENLEEWWALGLDKPELKKWLCEDKLQACCPLGHYGPTCTPCSKLGLNGKLCSGKGKCKGDGTRKGNGACQCDKGYTGEYCDGCQKVGYFQKESDLLVKDELKCEPCHRSCLDECTGAGPDQCLRCKKGYSLHTELGCTDIDECVTGNEDGGAKSRTAVCGKNEFCVNTDGNYKCSKCDQSCSTCHGDGPDSCDECAEGYTKNPDNVCITEKAAEIDSKATDEEAQKLEKTTTTSEFSPELDSLKSEL